MTKNVTYVKIMDSEESAKLFSDGEHQWNKVYRAAVMHIPARLSQADLSASGWKPGMPVPEMVAPPISGIEEIMIAVEAENGVVYTGTATRFYDPEQYDTKSHKVNTNFLLGDSQEALPLDDKMAQLGFDYTTNEPTP